MATLPPPPASLLSTSNATTLEEAIGVLAAVSTPAPIELATARLAQHIRALGYAFVDLTDKITGQANGDLERAAAFVAYAGATLFVQVAVSQALFLDVELRLYRQLLTLATVLGPYGTELQRQTLVTLQRAFTLLLEQGGLQAALRDPNGELAQLMKGAVAGAMAQPN